MKSKTIKKILNSKINNWIKSISNPGLQELLRENAIVTGGCIASMLLNEKVNDFDVYMKTPEAVKAVAEYYINQFKLENKVNNGIFLEWDEDRYRIVIQSAGIAKAKALEPGVERKPYSPVFISENAITLSNKLQITIRFYGEPAEIHETYDFVHCMNYWEAMHNELVLDPRALEAILNKELLYTGSMYPICSIIRTRKFIKRGWQIHAGNYIKMAYQISQMDLDDITVLKDQLIGVDSAYFSSLINALEIKHEKNPSFEMTKEYLSTVIDKIFE